jgi:prepilin-type N-terminal cleavage/methylation domain-containing protein
MRTLPRRHSRAFTLLELIIVVVVLGILAAIAIPTYTMVQNRSKKATAEQSLAAFGREVQAFNAFDHKGVITATSVADSISKITKIAAGDGVYADGTVGIGRGVAATHNPTVVSYQLGVDTGAGTVRPDTTATEAAWAGLAAKTSSGDCVGVRFNANSTVIVKMGDDCTGDAALGGRGQVTTPTPSTPATSTPPGTPSTAPSATSPTPPAAPAGTTGPAAAGSVTVNWAAVPGATSYTVYRNGEKLADVNAPTTTYTDGTAVNGTTYSYTITSTNASGLTSSPSAPISGTAYSVPSRPSIAQSLDWRDSRVIVSWSAVRSTAAAPVTGYRVYVDGVARPLTTDLTLDVTDLTNGTEYQIVVRAVSPSGESVDSAIRSGRPVAAPPTPQNLRVTAGTGTLTASWDAVTGTAAAPLRGYWVYIVGGDLEDGYKEAPATSSTTRTVSGLLPGSYTVYITSYGDNDRNESPQSSSVTVTVR